MIEERTVGKYNAEEALTVKHQRTSLLSGTRRAYLLASSTRPVKGHHTGRNRRIRATYVMVETNLPFDGCHALNEQGSRRETAMPNDPRGQGTRFLKRPAGLQDQKVVCGWTDIHSRSR